MKTQVLLIFRSPCREHDLRKGIEILAKTCVFIFHHSIPHDEASGYTFYNEADCPN